MCRLRKLCELQIYTGSLCCQKKHTNINLSWPITSSSLATVTEVKTLAYRTIKCMEHIKMYVMQVELCFQRRSWRLMKQRSLFSSQLQRKYSITHNSTSQIILRNWYFTNFFPPLYYEISSTKLYSEKRQTAQKHSCFTHLTKWIKLNSPPPPPNK